MMSWQYPEGAQEVGKLLCREGAKPETMAKFYLAVVQAVLLYGADTWIVSKRAINRLRSFHHRCGTILFIF
jgi:hypothetical protein